MQNLATLQKSHVKDLRFILTDIDDTLTLEGQLRPDAYTALWNLQQAGFHVIPVTGRPAGWCEMMARFWPISGIIGENGGFSFRYVNKKMKRDFFFDEASQTKHRKQLKAIEEEVLKKVPGCALASDQFCRLMDLAIDFCEDVSPLPQTEVQKIVDIFQLHGAQAKVSSIHVNGWFGSYDKKTMVLRFMEKEFGIIADQVKTQCAFVGDSPNDEPMFEFLPLSFAVANFSAFKNQVKHFPQFIADHDGGMGFTQIAETLVRFREN